MFNYVSPLPATEPKKMTRPNTLTKKQDIINSGLSVRALSTALVAVYEAWSRLELISFFSVLGLSCLLSSYVRPASRTCATVRCPPSSRCSAPPRPATHIISVEWCTHPPTHKRTHALTERLRDASFSSSSVFCILSRDWRQQHPLRLRLPRLRRIPTGLTSS